MIDLQRAIDRFKTGTYAVARQAAPQYVDGILAPGATSTASMDAAIHPITGRELEALPEAQAGKELRGVLTMFELRTQTPTSQPDLVTVGGEPWAVIDVKPWQVDGKTYFQCVIARVVASA